MVWYDTDLFGVRIRPTNVHMYNGKLKRITKRKTVLLGLLLKFVLNWQTTLVTLKLSKNWHMVLCLIAFKTVQITFHLTYFSGGGTVVLVITIQGNQVNVRNKDYLSSQSQDIFSALNR